MKDLFWSFWGIGFYMFFCLINKYERFFVDPYFVAGMRFATYLNTSVALVIVFWDKF